MERRQGGQAERMSLVHRFSVVALLLLGCSAQAQSDARLLEAIGQVESGMDRRALGKAGERGMYQMGKAAWTDANDLLKLEGHYSFSWGKWKDATAQDMVASAYLRVIRRRFSRIGIISPTPEQMAVCWNLGFSAAQSRGFPATGYAQRVANLFHLQGKAMQAK